MYESEDNEDEDGDEDDIFDDMPTDQEVVVVAPPAKKDALLPSAMSFSQHQHSQKRFRNDLEAEGTMAEKKRKQSHPSKSPPQLLKAARTNTSSLSILNLDNPTLLVHAMTCRGSVQNRQQHVADRLKIFVKHTLFRGIKFVNNETMIQKAMKKVMDHENVEDHHRVKFHMRVHSVKP